LLEIIYILSLIEEYCIAGKYLQEKNYAHRLVQKILVWLRGSRVGELGKYKNMLMSSYKSEVNIDRLFERCAELYSSHTQKDCSQIDIQEVDAKIALPCLRNIR
jgi:hypothetical protein